MNEELNTNTETNDSGSEDKEQKGRFYTDEEIAMLEQKAGDRRVSQFQKTMEKRNREANKLKNMSEAERAEYELSERERQLEERETKLILAENKSACVDVLISKGLDPALVDFVVDTEADAMDTKIKLLEKAFKKSVKAEVEKRLAGSSPKMNLPPDNAITKKDLLKMNIRELQQFKNQQPQLYRDLMGK